MPDPVPVASNLLDSKFLGFSVRRLLESMAIPVAPCAILHILRFPLLFTFPLFVVGIGVGVLIFVKTPPGQRPLRYTHAVFRHRMGENVYVWAPSNTLENDLASGARQDDWLTQPPNPGVTTNHPRHAGTATATTADRGSTDRSAGPDIGEEAR
jgi:hypothetical protein